MMEDRPTSSVPGEQPASSLAAPAPGRTRKLVLLVDRWILRFTHHWLILFNLAVGLYVGLPFLAPTLMHLGFEGPGRLIYTLYVPNCHQLPERSFFLFGDRWTYSLDELPPAAQGPTQSSSCTECLPIGLSKDVPAATEDTLSARRYFYGDPETGYKMAICQRDVGIYGAVLLAGLIYGLLRRRIRPLPFPYFLILCIPLAVDGVAQLLGLWESTWFNRLITGGLLGMALVWLAYPHVQIAMDELREDLEDRLLAES